MSRDEAYKAVQENAMAAWDSDTSFRERVSKDERIAKYLDSKALAHTFDLQRQLRYVDAIFERVFGAHRAGEKSAAGSTGKSKLKNENRKWETQISNLEPQNGKSK